MTFSNAQRKSSILRNIAKAKKSKICQSTVSLPDESHETNQNQIAQWPTAHILKVVGPMKKQGKEENYEHL